MPIRKFLWRTRDQFQYQEPGRLLPVFDNTEIEGFGATAFLRLKDLGSASSHVDFETPAQYDYDPSKIQVSGGRAILVPSVLHDEHYTFDDPSDYTFDSAKIEVSGSAARLVGNPIATYAWWHLNESTGLMANDSSGNGRNGALVNMESGDWVPGKLNNCLIFDGANEYVNCGNIANFDRLDTFSLEAWVRTTVTGMDILTRYDGVRGYIFYLAATGKVFFTIRNAAGVNEASRYSKGSVVDGLWHHVVVTYDGSSENTGISIYIDGADDTDLASGHNSLTASITNVTTLNIGGRGTSGNFKGNIDEVVVYDFELTAANVAYRYNAGTGTEMMPGAFFVNNPSICPDTGMVFVISLGQFVEVAAKPPGTEIKYHISADDGVTWRYWNGGAWVVTDDSYDQANTEVEVNANIFSLAVSGTFKFRALLHSDDGSATPELDNVYLAEGVTFPIGDWPLEMLFDLQPTQVSEWASVVETATVPVGTSLLYQYSQDGGATYNGVWLTRAALESALQGLATAGDGSDKVRFKLQLSTTDLMKSPSIDNLEIQHDQGYAKSGSYTSTNPYPYPAWFSGIYLEQIEFDLLTPAGTSGIVRMRPSTHMLAEWPDEPWPAYSDGDDLLVCSDDPQWQVEFTTDHPAQSPQLNELSLSYHMLVGIMQTMDQNVTVLRQHQTNRKRIDTATGQLVVYADDGVTEIQRLQLLDVAGQPASTDVFERKPT